MRRTLASLIVLTCLAVVASAAGETFAVLRTFRVGGAGGWDLLAVDGLAKRLYVPRGTHTMVLDEETGAVLADIPGQQRAHGVAVVPALHRGFITDGGDGTVVVFDLETFKVLGKVKADADADDVRYDPASERVLVACGDPSVMIPLRPDVDPASGAADPAIDLGGKPEAFAVDGRGKAYVAMNDKDCVAVVDTKARKVVARWPTSPAGAPVGVALDGAQRRLYVSCRKPATMVVMSADDGKVLASLAIGEGTDGAAFDDGTAFASCRDGSLSLVREVSPGTFQLVQTVKTAVGSRTLGLDPTTHRLYVPAADFAPPAPGQRRPSAKEGTFRVLVVGVAPTH